MQLVSAVHEAQAEGEQGADAGRLKIALARLRERAGEPSEDKD